ncbi:hypothetical protein [Nitrospirillum sp. BR 11163]|uniref:hypothetical protein n=1 Tax=Nitrospirillum sp. BR 11163 TaxID=3104323 RepID=UPI002AFE7342|nr:hypothetical protein [Nitrospirillum sp. BR 11163]MEA1674086.1 hypothetical protein [Nitrospirillum sp. BR 11163]
MLGYKTTSYEGAGSGGGWLWDGEDEPVDAGAVHAAVASVLTRSDRILVQGYAELATVPDWRPNPLCRLVPATRRTDGGRDRRIVIRDRRGHEYLSALDYATYRPWDVWVSRTAYLCWWDAVGRVADALVGKLQTHTLTGARSPRQPWLANPKAHWPWGDDMPVIQAAEARWMQAFEDAFHAKGYRAKAGADAPTVAALLSGDATSC